VDVLLTDGARSICLRLSRGGPPAEIAASEQGLRSAAATDDDFATIDLSGKLNRWPDSRQPLDRLHHVEWISIDLARGSDVTLAAGIGKYDDVYVLHVTRSDADRSVLRRMALSGRCACVAVARPAGA